jgi:hypothetical protein
MVELGVFFSAVLTAEAAEAARGCDTRTGWFSSTET